MLQSIPTFRVSGDDRHPPQHYRIIGRNVQFSKDGRHWRTLNSDDVDLHIRLRTPVALWIENHLQPLRRGPKIEFFSGPERRRINSKLG